MKIPWCSWCESYHHKKAQHILRKRWLLPNTHQLFKSRAAALKMGYGTSEHSKPIEVMVIPINFKPCGV